MARDILLQTSTERLGDLLANGKTYSVPPFQRDYSWREENWEDLWSDVLALRQAGPTHYMGSLVLQPRSESNSFWIIDGQQRLTTLSLLAASVIRRLLALAEEGQEPEQNSERAELLRGQFLGSKDPRSLLPRSRLHLNRRNQLVFQRHLSQLKEPPNLYGLSDSERRLCRAFNYFGQKVQAAGLNGQELAGFLSHDLANRLLFIQILVEDDLSAYAVFETLNTRSLQLTSTDLLKNYLFSLCDESAVDLLHEQWLRITAGVGEQRFPEFLRHYLLSTGIPVRSERVFKELRKQVQQPSQALEMLDILEGEASRYRALLDPSDERWRGQNDRLAWLRVLALLQLRQMLPFLMAAGRHLDGDALTGVLRLSTVLGFRYSIIGGLNLNELEQACSRAAASLGPGSTGADAFAVVRQVYVSDKWFEHDFAYASPRSRKLARYILCELERDASGMGRDREQDDACLEHILPLQPGPGWESSFPGATHADWVYRLGNYALLEPHLNREAGNSSFEAKRALYARSQYQVTRQLADLAEWTPALLESRQRRMAARACHLWRVDY